MNNNQILKVEFKKYRDNYHECVSDTTFIASCVSEYAKDLEKKLPFQNYYFDTAFFVHNVGPNADDTLKSYNTENYTITPKDIQKWQNAFFSNINIIHIVKFYNAIERFLIISIRNAFFPDVIINNHLQQNINISINKLGYKDKKNNKHLIDFLNETSESCREFLSEKLNVDQNLSWKDFFKLLSVLRNNIAHNGGYIDTDIINNLKGINTKIVDQYFSLESERLVVKDNIQFLNFFGYCDRLCINLIKFIHNETELEFLKMY